MEISKSKSYKIFLLLYIDIGIEATHPIWDVLSKVELRCCCSMICTED